MRDDVYESCALNAQKRLLLNELIFVRAPVRVGAVAEQLHVEDRGRVAVDGQAPLAGEPILHGAQARGVAHQRLGALLAEALLVARAPRRLVIVDEGALLARGEVGQIRPMHGHVGLAQTQIEVVVFFAPTEVPAQNGI